MSTSPVSPQSEASKILGLLYVLGITAASIFIKNPAHVQTAGNIVNLLNTVLPDIEGIL